MRHTFTTALLLVGTLLMLIPGTSNAQFVWQETNSYQDWRYYYDFRSVTCNGSHCVAVALATDGIRRVAEEVFLISKDGGRTWQATSSGLAPRLNLLDLRRIHAMQQIDEATIVAVGDSGLFVCSHDGGTTWQTYPLATNNPILDVHFSDRYNGIAVAYGYETIGNIFTTVDGGVHWRAPTVPTIDASMLASCFCNGLGKYRVFSMGQHRFYGTDDNWGTITGSASFLDSAADSLQNSFYFYGCRLDGDSTVIAYGESFTGGGVLIRSDDGGRHWAPPAVFTEPPSLTLVTTLAKDEVFAADVEFGSNAVLRSTDSGRTWSVDSTRFTNSVEGGGFRSIDYGGPDPVAVLAQALPIGNWFVLARGIREGSSVRPLPRGDQASKVSPNPANELAQVSTPAWCRVVELVDMVGRVVAAVPSQGKTVVTLDVRSMPAGVYTLLMVGSKGASCSVSKLVISHAL